MAKKDSIVSDFHEPRMISNPDDHQPAENSIPLHLQPPKNEIESADIRIRHTRRNRRGKKKS